MGKLYLLPHRFKKFGWVLLLSGLVFGISTYVFKADSDYFGRLPFLSIWSNSLTEDSFFTVIRNGFLDELISLLIIVGGILVGFCKTKVEDEFISQIRLSSLVWSMYVNYAVLLLAILFIFDMAFFDVMLFNMFTVLLFFVARFHVLLYKAQKM